MLIAMSKSSDNWFVKIFLGIVVLGFIATGGLLSYSSVQSSNYVASVGDANVTGDEFYAEYSQEANNYSRRLGQQLQPEFLNLIEQTVMERMINRAALDNTGMVLNLAIDDEVAAKTITDNPNFQSISGEFDKSTFDGLMRQNNLTEKDYVKLIKDQKIIDQLTDGLANIQFSPEIFTSVIAEFKDQERIAEFFHISPANVEIGETPTGDELETFYKTVITQFDAPEYRQADTLTLDAETIAKSMVPNADEVKDLYELSKDSYNSVETRDLSQLVYDNMEDAQAAYKKAQDGTTFAELALEKGIADTSYKIGSFAKASLPNQKMADIAFALEANQVSEPIDLGLGIALVNVSSITPAIVKTFEDVKASIEQSEALRLAIDKVYEMRDVVEDEIAGGATFKEISQKIEITYNNIPALSTSSEDVDGNAVEAGITPALLSGIFTTDEAIDNEPLDTANGGLQWYVVNKITERTNKNLADVKDEVNALWRSQETAQALLAKAESLSATGGEIGILSEGIVDAVSIASAVTRSTQSVQLSQEAITALFAIKQNEYAFVPSQQNGEDTYIMMQLKEIITPDTNELGEENSQIAQSIAPNLAATLLESYIENNKGVYGISINQDLVDRITGAETANQ
ncbi:MAG: SurA N-terminal domain-containing protein [Hyphomicrobiales bacterium]